MEHVKGPIGVVAVAGMYRTGKSYLLNRLLLNRKRGYKFVIKGIKLIHSRSAVSVDV